MFLKSMPRYFRSRLSNRILDESISVDQVEGIPLPEIVALLRLKLHHDMETVMHKRNERLQRAIRTTTIKESDNIIGFDTSSWIIARRAQQLGKPFFLDQSIAHPREKMSLFKALREQFPSWGEDIPMKEELFMKEEDSEHKLAHCIVVASSFTRNSLIKQGVSSDKIKLNPYGVGEEFFSKKEKSSREKVRFVYMGTLGARKGLPFLMEAWMKHKLYNKAELWLAGPASEYVQGQVAQTPGMNYRGRLSHKDIPGLLKECDCLLFPTFFEGFGQVILEAMAAGLSVITTEAAAGPDIIEDGVDGWLVQSGDVDGIARAIEKMCSDSTLSYAMGKLAQEKARSFTWDAYGDRWKKILKH